MTLPKAPPKPKKPRKDSARTTPPFVSTATDSISNKITRVLSAKDSPVDIEEIALEFYTQVGGAAGFVQTIMGAYGMTRVGSAEQARLLDIMTDLFKRADAKRGATDLDASSDEDLEKIAIQLAQKSGIVGLPIQDWIDHVCI